jgi:hypothetical protein
MRAGFLGFLLFGLVAAQSANAQVYRFETPPPAVTAAGASWQLNGDPIFHAGNFYYPTGPTVFFDGRVMVRVDNWFGVPIYEDSTLEPYSMLFVPVGGNQMRPYERRREGALAGTVGSRVPSFPVQQASEWPDVTGTTGLAVPPPVNRRGVLQDRSSASSPEFVAHGVVTIGAPDTTSPGEPSGLWIDFNGARWYSAGRALEYDAGRFERAGDYRGFAVYRDRSGPADRIYVSTVAGGPLAPFERR